ncbi:MAG: LrgB family protein [Clostridia bacterium]|nr:LrgB family protein [Clostridia bacterium]
MKDLFLSSLFIGAGISLLAYFSGVYLKNRFKSGIFNPLLIAIVLTIAFLKILDIDYETYNMSAKYISYFLTPATVSLAIPLYEELELLKRHYKAITAAILSGVVTSLVTVFLLSKIFGLTHSEYVTFLPKSITTAIGMGVSEELGGYVTITVAVIVLTGVFGNIFGELILKLLKVKEPISKGLAYGTASHAIGTAKAMEIGEIEGAMSSLSVCVAGILTVILAPLFANLI